MSGEPRSYTRRMEISIWTYPRRTKPQTTCIEAKPTDYETYEEYVSEFQLAGKAVRLSEAKFNASKSSAGR